MKKIFETGIMILCIAGFFGFIYPELCLDIDMAAAPTKYSSKVCYENFALPPDRIKLRSGLWEFVTGNTTPIK